MKKFLVLLFLVSSAINAQYKITGTMNPPYQSNWVILYKIEGARQVFVANTEAKKSNNTATFSFTLPKNTTPGYYRATYDIQRAGYVDFLFNKENISFSFNPNNPQEIDFKTSKENKLYSEYVLKISRAQQQLDSIQMIALKNPKQSIQKNYTTYLNNLNGIQKKYLAKTKGLLLRNFVVATARKNPAKPFTDLNQYLNYTTKNFFANINFNNKALYNSSFLVDRINDYIFYLNYSPNAKKQEELHKKAVADVYKKISNVTFKRDITELLINQFGRLKNLKMVDFLFKNNYKTLPKKLQNKKFIEETMAKLAIEIGRIAPDFSWKEKGKNYSLSKLTGAEKYIIVFWSTDCSHCLREIPQLYEFMKAHKNTKVLAFAMEDIASKWEKYKLKLAGWHNILGLDKWENKTSRKYQVFSTPNYFILDKNKKIIAKPEDINGVKKFYNK